MLKDPEISTPARLPAPAPTAAAAGAGRPPVRVYFINRYFYPDESATAQLLADLAFGLAMRDFEVHIVCSRQLYGAPEPRLQPREIVRGVAVHRIWTTRFGRRRLLGRGLDYLSFYATCGFTLLRRLRRGDIVVAKTDPPLISVVAALASAVRRAVLINWLQDIFPEVASQLGASPLPAVLDGLLRRARDASLRAAAANIVLGSRMREYLITRNVPAQTIEVLANWADTEQVRPKAPCDSALRSQLRLQQKFVVGYSGNLGRAHDYLTLLGAAEFLRDDGGVAFLVIGGGAKMAELQSTVAGRHLPNVHFLPYQSRESLGDSLAASDVHLAILNPSLEGLIVPSKFYGILAAGRPVVFLGDRDGELARIIEDVHCGLVVEIGRSADLVKAIRDLQADDKAREAMGLSSRQLLLENYSASRALENWERLLLRVRRVADVKDSSQ